jgi:hypothetical protein
MRIIICLIISIAITGCAPSIGEVQQVGITDQKNVIERNAPKPRFTIIYQGKFSGGEADFKTYRAIYTIIDNSTGQEFLGIEGVGVSSLTSSGKTSCEK